MAGEYSSYWGQSSGTAPSSADEITNMPPPPPPVDAGLYYGAPTDYQAPQAAPLDLGAMAFGPPPAAPAPAAEPPRGPPMAPGDPGFANSVMAGTTPVAPPGPAPSPSPAPSADGPAIGFKIPAGAPRQGATPARPAGGPSGPRGPSALDRAQSAFRGTYDADKGALQRGADAEEGRNDFVSEQAEILARKKLDDQMIQRLEAAESAKTFGDYSAETQRQIDDVRQQKVNPNRAYADTGSAVAAVLGGLMGGIYTGLNKLEKNPFIEQMNKVIDRDIAAQEHDLRTRKEGIGERKGLLAEMRTTYKDEEAAKLQARNLYYEGAKEELMAQAGKYDSPAIQARVDQAITALTRAQDQLDINKALQDLANARAAAAAAAAQRELDFKHKLELDQHSQGWAKLGIESANVKTTAGKERRESLQHLGDKLGEVDKQGAATDLEGLRRYLIDPATGQVDRSRSIPGVGRLADLRESVAPPLGKGGALDVAGAAGPAGWAVRGGTSAVLGLSPEERQNKNAYERTFLAFKNIKTGSASSEQEHQRLLNAWEGAKTTEEVGAAVDQAYAFIQRHKDAIRAENPEATAEYEGNVRDLKVQDANTAKGRERVGK